MTSFQIPRYYFYIAYFVWQLKIFKFNLLWWKKEKQQIFEFEKQEPDIGLSYLSMNNRLVWLTISYSLQH